MNKLILIFAAAVVVMGGVARAETASDIECGKPEYVDAARSALSRLLELKDISNENRQRPGLLSKPTPVQNFDSMLFIAPSACLFDVAGSKEELDAGVSQGDITVTRTIDGAIKADRIGLPDYTAESVVAGLQKRCSWASLLNDAQRHFDSTKLGVLEAAPHMVQAIFSASTRDGKGYVGGRLTFKFHGYDGKRYWADFDAALRRGGCFVDFFHYYLDKSQG